MNADCYVRNVLDHVMPSADVIGIERFSLRHDDPLAHTLAKLEQAFQKSTSKR